jgi:flap endonuclease-1
MGIKDLYPTLRSLCPNVFNTVKLSDLGGSKIAVDISIFLYKFIKTAEQGKWINFYIRFLCAFRKHNIKLICIFDGANCPQEKRDEQQRRRAETQRSVSKMHLVNETYEQLKMFNELQAEKFYESSNPDFAGTGAFKYQIDQELVQNINMILKKDDSSKTTFADLPNLLPFLPSEDGDVCAQPPSSEEYESFSFISMEQELKKILMRLEKQTAPITQDHSATALEITKILGVPCFQADGEAEGLCAFLCKHGVVDMVLSEDTDVLAYGTPYFLSKLDLKEEVAMLTSFQDILDSLQFTEPQFRDLCIMLGCDYNDRVKGIPPAVGCTKHESHTAYKKSTGIGTKAAVCMMDVYKSLEEVEKHCIDIEKLNYKRCREIFEMKDIGNIDPGFFSADPGIVQRERLADFLVEHEVYIQKNYILKIFDS